MPPKVKITRDNIIDSALRIIRQKGMEALGARNIAADLGCSTQPVFSNFSTMEELKAAAIQAADALYQDYLRREIDRCEFPPYKASGMAYIRFAREERQLFRLLFMRNRSGEKIDETTEELEQLTALLQRTVGLSREDAFLFHLEMWMYVHGIATMIATSYLEWDQQMISQMLTDA
ncbi:MAG: TetR/AcrR family transcriptional regulator, partial [Lachnospiraceae bacterium]|nr:TetR/AcrR family transcriptional regulator [Lachnospiraceae bacterium]